MAERKTFIATETFRRERRVADRRNTGKDLEKYKLTPNQMRFLVERFEGRIGAYTHAATERVVVSKGLCVQRAIGGTFIPDLTAEGARIAEIIKRTDARFR